MNVLFLSHMFQSSANPMAGIFVLEQMSALRELGVQITTVSPIPWVPSLLGALPRGRKYFLAPHAGEVQRFPVVYPRVMCFPRDRFFSLYGVSYYLGCLGAVRRLVDLHKVQVIHAHTIMPDGFAGVLLGRTLGLPVVCTIHGSDINIHPFRSRASRWATRWALQRVDRVMTVSHRLRAKVQELAGPVPVEVAPNSADPARFKPQPRDEARRSLNLPLDKKIVLFVGSFFEEKGAEFLLQAFARLDRTNTVLYLVGDGILRASLTALAASLGIDGVTVFVGRRPHAEIPRWLASADCLVMPSLNEGLPTLLAEAMLCRVPVVATDAGGIPELLVHQERGWLVPRRDVAGLAEGIGVMLSQPERVAPMLDRAQQVALAGYTWRQNADTVLRIYDEAVQGRRSG